MAIHCRAAKNSLRGTLVLAFFIAASEGLRFNVTVTSYSKKLNLSESVFGDFLRSPGIDSQPGGPVRQHYFSYWPARQHSLAESIPGLHKCLQIRALGI